MPLKQPESVDECLYFTRRKLLPKGMVMAWAFRKHCPKCHKGLMKKPKKTALSYVCPACSYEEEKKAHENGVIVNVQYTCPCGHAGEATTEYQRKSWQGVKAYVFTCEACKQKIGITKKLKEPKKKDASPIDDDD